MEERLERVLNRVIDWVKYEEAKNAALVTLDGVGFGVIAASSSPSPWLKGSQVIFLISLMIASYSFHPVVKNDKLHKNAVRRRKRSQRILSNSHLLFFADIAGSDPVAYLNEFRLAVGETSGITVLELDYAREIVTNAEIAVQKLRLFEAGLLVSVLAFILATIATLVAAVSSGQVKGF
jgi:hypothetical protein